ncbi:MAG TPA: ABC transporter permease [Anaeromyxobacter sp.]|nr:ABC transporter permease [Anaeromyxobacter sp.]
MTALLDTVAMALATLRANVLRSILTLLGIVIGATTVVAMMSLTEGLRLKLDSDFSVLGAGAFVISKYPAVSFGPMDWRKYERRRNLTREDAEALRGLPHVAHVSIEESIWKPERLATRERETKTNITLSGVNVDWEQTSGLQVARGRFLSEGDLELGRRVTFIGPEVADMLFPGEEPVGREVRIRGVPFEVVGVAERRGSILGLESKDGFAAVPWTAYEAALGRARDLVLGVSATTPDAAGKAIDETTAVLRRLRGVAPDEESDFEIFSNDSLSETFDSLATLVGAATFGVCALALLVGGIGIMNIMLVSVTERTREIGIRKALGARRRRILSQFLVEAVTLSALGGLAGVLAGAGIAVTAREVFQVPASIPAWAVVVSLAAACGTGLLFGIYPAARASKLDPVEAMRIE